MSLWKLLNGRWGSGVGETDEIRIDSSTNSLQTVDYEHHEIHSGSHFFFTFADNDWDIVDGYDFIFTTPDSTDQCHAIFEVNAAFDTTVEYYEDTTHTTGALQTSYNNNRVIGTAPTATIHLSNDDVADGTLLFSSVFGVSTGVGINSIIGGGEARGTNEIILKRDSKYLFRMVTGTDASVLSIRFNWYEHTIKH
jgi:hypothetical protein